MQENKKNRYMTVFLLLGICTAVFVILNICIGSVRITLPDMIKIFAGSGDDETLKKILVDIRFPRAVAVLILGGALSLAGYLLQTFFNNPIAGPFVLGISSGAKMVVALIMVFLLGRSVRVTSGTMIFGAFIGAMLSMGFVLLLSNRVSSMSMLVVSGVMIGYICSAITELVVTFADDADIVNLHNWSRGSFSGMTWENVEVMAVVVFMTFLAVCPERRCKHTSASGMYRDFLQYFICVYCSICRSDFLCRNCSAASDQKASSYSRPHLDDTVLFSGRECFLPALRSAGENDVGTYGT